MTAAAARLGAALGLAALVAAAGCGSVTARRDGGGSGGHADSATRMDLAADRAAEDARADAPARDTAGQDMRMTDARGIDARMTDARMTDARMTDARISDARISDGATRDAPASDTGGGGECKSNGDCLLYPGAGAGCCGVCQPKSDPAPPPVECLVACLTPLVTCGCVNQQCVGSKKQL